MKTLFIVIGLFFGLIILGPWLDGNLIVDLPQSKKLIAFIFKFLLCLIIVWVFYLIGLEAQEAQQRKRKNK